MGKGTDNGMAFSCTECGSPYTIYPPESGYGVARSTVCERGCNKPMRVLCQKCRHTMTMYWCTGHPIGMITR